MAMAKNIKAYGAYDHGWSQAEGFAAGASSVWRVYGHGHPAPPTVCHSGGSLQRDTHAIQSDGDRLFQHDHSRRDSHTSRY